MPAVSGARVRRNPSLRGTKSDARSALERAHDLPGRSGDRFFARFVCQEGGEFQPDFDLVRVLRRSFSDEQLSASQALSPLDALDPVARDELSKPDQRFPRCARAIGFRATRGRPRNGVGVASLRTNAG